MQEHIFTASIHIGLCRKKGNKMTDSDNRYQKPRRVSQAFRSPAFSKYLIVSLIAIFVIILFVAFIWLAGARQPGIPKEIYFSQLDTPEDGQPIVVFETNFGDIKAVLYPDDAPAYCEYFTNLVNSGYYDGSYFCAVADTAYALGGAKNQDPNNAETEDSDMTSVEAEISNNLWPIRGSLASFIGSKGVWPFNKNYAGSTFIMINDIDDAYMDESALKRAYGDQLGGVFAEKGGIPNFSRKYTIFAQIYDGWDVFERIMSAEVLETSQPAEDIIIEKAYISTYGENN